MPHEVHRRENEFDVIHFHVDLIHFPFFQELAQRTVTTLHCRLDLEDLPRAYARWPHYSLVSISNDRGVPLPAANWVRSIQHGLSDDLLRPVASLGERLSRLPRPDLAGEAARP